MKRIAIIGGGPIGLEAAVYGRQSGFAVDLYEKGPLAANMRDWGHVRLFSPFQMNVSSWSQRALAEGRPDLRLPTGDQFLTGREFAERYLIPVSQLPLLAGCLHEQMTVIGVSRTQLWKGDLIGQRARSDTPFRLLIKRSDGTEQDAVADYVLDCSGVYSHHNWLGAGGLPAIGEIEAASGIEYRVPEITDNNYPEYAGKRTLVVGSGYSAATAIAALAQLAQSDPTTRIVWVTRTDRTPPLHTIDNDPLLERGALAAAANRWALAADSPVMFLPRRYVVQIAGSQGQGGYHVVLRGPDGKTESLAVDRIIANVGYHPDRSIYEELQVHECYATSGPIKLAAALLGNGSSDCLQQSPLGAETLRNPEPGFFILGAKSYGRDSRFLIRVGLEQIVDVFRLIADDCRSPGKPAAEQGAQQQQ